MAEDHELRIVARHEGRHALMIWVTVERGEVHYGERFHHVEFIRGTHHASGARNLHFPVPLEPDEPYIRKYGPKMTAFTGTEELDVRAPALNALDWNYRPKDRNTNLIIEGDGTYRVNVWLVELGRRDLVDDLLARHGEVFGYELLDRCDPQVLAIVSAIPPEVIKMMENLERDVRASRERETRSGN